MGGKPGIFLHQSSAFPQTSSAPPRPWLRRLPQGRTLGPKFPKFSATSRQRSLRSSSREMLPCLSVTDHTSTTSDRSFNWSCCKTASKCGQSWSRRLVAGFSCRTEGWQVLIRAALTLGGQTLSQVPEKSTFLSHRSVLGLPPTVTRQTFSYGLVRPRASASIEETANDHVVSVLAALKLSGSSTAESRPDSHDPPDYLHWGSNATTAEELEPELHEPCSRRMVSTCSRLHLSSPAPPCCHSSNGKSPHPRPDPSLRSRPNERIEGQPPSILIEGCSAS
ncbi:hypothetical protein T11_1617 [Trichinella zimbabwensis]|uniref:Uncharacterized protein n=1 Tax=Trichinella zimbabwensis TaxID=268475 RepID=A0A0V1GUN2_9BILA|nr:hypothetical protein T11_1617 [Trichinella zimbabwensis]